MKRLRWMTGLLLLSARLGHADDPDLGPNVRLFDPSQSGIQQQVDALFAEQEDAQFGTGRYALLFKPGKYDVDVPVGFYTQVSGLGRGPDDVTINGRVWTDAAWMRHNATCNFWRCVENLAIAPPARGNVWAVSQGASMRRTHVRGDLHLSAGGWASGGYFSDCQIDGNVNAGSQQQWFARNSQFQKWQGGAWNMTLVGCLGAPPERWPTTPFTVVERAPVSREKPFICLDETGRWGVNVPALRRESAGVTWAEHAAPGQFVPLDAFYIARPDRDNAATLNAALREGHHLLLTPGEYRLSDSLVVPRPGTLVLGLGLPSLFAPPGQVVMRVDAGEGVILAGLLLEATEPSSDTLLQIGQPGRRAGKADNPTSLHDIFARVGGYGPGKTRTMVTIHDSFVLLDHLWLWRADHGKDVGWSANTCDTGLRVEGDDVTSYGLFVEHTQANQVIWNGNGGRVYFYQSEMPYDPPSADAWKGASGEGFASYKVGANVTTHSAWGLGIYHVFKKSPVIATSAIEVPDAPGIHVHHALTFRLGGGQHGSGIRHVINEQGGETITSEKATIDAK